MSDLEEYSDGFFTLDGEIEIDEAATIGDFSQVKKTLCRCGHDLDVCEMVLQSAVWNGHVEIVEYLDSIDNTNALLWHEAITGLIENDKLETVKHLMEKRQNTMNLELYLQLICAVAEESENMELRKYFEEFEKTWSMKKEKRRRSRSKIVCKPQFSESWN